MCKRFDRRLRDLGLADVDEYRRHLDGSIEEWRRLDQMSRITISRFCRDGAVFATLAQQVLPALANESQRCDSRDLRIWSAGCGSGEEPYTLSILWKCGLQAQFPGTMIEIVSTDADPDLIDRALEVRYGFSSLKDLPERWRATAFEHEGSFYRLRRGCRRDVRFLEQDIRQARPEGLFDLVLCRNLVFTYYDDEMQVDLPRQIISAITVARHC